VPSAGVQRAVAEVTPEDLVRLAQRVVKEARVPPGTRMVVALTDEEGAAVGVSCNTHPGDAQAILDSALNSRDKRPFIDVIDMPADPAELTEGDDL
jgi:hypothetical protein